MRLGTRSRIAIAAAVLSGSALLAPTNPAAALYPEGCTPDTCDLYQRFYSDSTKTVVVGEFEDGPCGQVNWGVQTMYQVHVVRRC
jgi:hypothetical protein